MIQTKYRDITTGQEFATLPKIHRNTSPITEANYQLVGLEAFTVEIADPEPPAKRYSKLKLCRALKAASLWDSIKATIESAGAMDEWLLAQDLADDDAIFLAIIQNVESQFPDLNVEEILQGCEI